MLRWTAQEGIKEKENLFIAGCCANPGQLFAGACISGYLNEEGLRVY